MKNKFTIAITTLSGKRVKLSKRFKTKSKAEEFKERIIDVRKRKGSSKLVRFNPRVVKLK